MISLPFAIPVEWPPDCLRSMVLSGTIREEVALCVRKRHLITIDNLCFVLCFECSLAEAYLKTYNKRFFVNFELVFFKTREFICYNKVI